jgi:hypothetical protein
VYTGHIKKRLPAQKIGCLNKESGELSMVVRLGLIGGGKFGLMHLRAFSQLEYENRVRQ